MPGLLLPRARVHVATSAHLRAVMPFQTQSGLGGRGVYLGRDSSGGAFCYCPFELYRQGVVTGPGMVVLGEIGRGKSALVKSYLYRQIGVFHRHGIVISPKPHEYDHLAHALNGSLIQLAPGRGVVLNPLATHQPEDAARALRGVAAVTLGRPLAPAEDAALAAALTTISRSGRAPTLPRVVEVLFDPPDRAWEARWRSREAWLDESRPVALALDRLITGDARGMFDGETTPGLDLDAPLVVLDLSSVAESAAVSILTTAALAWTHTRLKTETEHDRRQRILVVDEAWRVLANPAAAEALLDTVKHSRAYGVQTITITHRIDDLRAAGDHGTRLSRVAEGLLSDAETKVVYAQPADQLTLIQERIGLTTTEAQLLPRLGRGEAIWKVATRSLLVTHQLSEPERAICDTDQRMRP